MNSLRSILSQHRQWLFQAEGMVARELDYIDEDLAEGSLGGLANVSDSLGMLATYHGIQGEVAICSGDASGWRAVSIALVYRYWALKLKAHGFSATHFLGSLNKGPNLTNQLSNAGCLLAAFIAADRRDLAGSVAEMLAGMLRVERAIDAHYLKRRQFEPFMLWLYGRYLAQATARVGSELGVYQQVIDCWVDEQGLGEALREVSQYHLANMDDQGGDWDPGSSTHLSICCRLRLLPFSRFGRKSDWLHRLSSIP